MQQKLYFTNSKGDKLTAILSAPDEDQSRPLVIMAHGFSSSKASEKYIRLESILNERGIAIFRFDFYGHGESDGEFEDITVSEAVDDIFRAYNFSKEKLGYKTIGLFGSSFGGLASILAAAKLPDLRFLALFSPVSDYEEKFRKDIGEIARWKGRGFTHYETHKGEQKRLNQAFYEDAVQPTSKAYSSAAKIRCPVLVVHGDRDEAVPVGQSQKLAKLISGSHLEIIAGADHRHTDPAHSERAIKLISDFIIEHAK